MCQRETATCSGQVPIAALIYFAAKVDLRVLTFASAIGMSDLQMPLLKLHISKELYFLQALRK
jgi:hypothetical protein